VTDVPGKVIFYGGAPGPREVFPVFAGSTDIGSFFEWDGGNAGRILAYMNLIGYYKLYGASSEELAAAMPTIREMPVWPAKASVQELNDVTLVKLGPIPGYGQTR
jgi:hypothetical protein